MSLFYFAANLCCVWLRGRWLDSLICSCVRSDAISHVMCLLENATLEGE